MFKSEYSKIIFYLFILVGLIQAQNQDPSNLNMLFPEVITELENEIRMEKFDRILPRVMRDNNIDMWIHIIRSWIPDPLRFELGSNSGVFIFTDYGGDRIERIAFSNQLRDPTIYDKVIKENTRDESIIGNAFRDGTPVEQPGSPMELDIRFAGLQKLVIERQPKNIAVNYMDDFSTASSSEFSPLTDGISHKDYNLLIETLGKKYARRVKSAEYLIMDYLAGRVPMEIELYKKFGVIAAENLDREFNKVIPGITKLSELEGNVFLRVPDGREIHASDPEPYVLKRGDLFTILHGAGNKIFHSDLGGNAYILRKGETELPAEIKEIWEHAMNVRKILKKHIRPGRTAGETLNLLIRKIEEAGYYYNPIDHYAEGVDPKKTQIHLDCHAVGRSGLLGPRISPLGPDWVRNMNIPLLHTFTFEYMVHMPVPKWGKGKHLYIAFHDGAVVTDKGVVFPYPPDQGIRIIH